MSSTTHFYQPTLPEWLYAAFEGRKYTDLSCVCNWAHAMFENGDGLTVEVVMIEREGSKPAIRLLAMDMRDEVQLSDEVKARVAGAKNPAEAQLLAEIEAESNKPFERYITQMVSTPDALVAALAAFEKELDY